MEMDANHSIRFMFALDINVHPFAPTPDERRNQHMDDLSTDKASS